MSGNAAPSPEFEHLDADTREWIIVRSGWLLDQFGWERVRSCPIILPTAEFFPGEFSGTADDTRLMLARMCDFLEIDAERIDLDFFEHQPPDNCESWAGGYEQQDQRFHIWIEVSELGQPLDLAATMAHELCHIHLLGDRRVDQDANDHEPLRDLLTVFLGLGVITANGALSEDSWRSGGWEGWSIRRRGYCTMPMYGYALALFSRIRDEFAPTWPRYLRPDVRHAFQLSQKHLAQHGLPDLRTVRTTDARPTHLSPAQQDANRQQLQTEITSGVGRCTYCGTSLPDNLMASGVCHECRTSIEENQEEFEAEQREEQESSQRSIALLKWSFFGFLLYGLIYVILDWLGMR